MRELSDLDVQPEPDLPGSTLASLSLGLIVGDGMILFTGIGAILGQLYLSNALGLGQDLLMGAMIGALVGLLLALEFVKVLTDRFRRIEAR